MKKIDHGNRVVVKGWNVSYTVVSLKKYIEKMGVEPPKEEVSMYDDMIWVNNSGANYIYGSPEKETDLIVLNDGEIVDHDGMKFEVRANDVHHYEPISFVYIPPEYE